MVICLKQLVQTKFYSPASMMPRPLTVSCFSKIQAGFTFLVPADLGSHGKKSVKRVLFCYLLTYLSIIAVSVVTATPGTHRKDARNSQTQTIIIIVVVSVIAVLFLVTILLFIFHCRKRGQYKRYDYRLYSPASVRTVAVKKNNLN